MSKKTKILVFSDSHGDHGDMEYIIDRIHPDAEYVLHLGDGESDIEKLSLQFPRQAFVTIKGNCDWGFGNGYNGAHRTLDIEGVRIFMCHGHRHSVSGGDYSVLTAAANSLRADIALFGHTHYSEYFITTKAGKTDVNEPGAALHVMNPGSVARPRGGTIKDKSYGIILLDEKGGIDISLHAV